MNGGNVNGGLVFGRSPNLVLGALTAIYNVFVIAHVPGVWDPAVVAAVNIALGAVIALIANSPSIQVAAGDAAKDRASK